MTTIFCVILLACSFFLSGCRPCRPDSQLSKEKAADNEECRILQIENFTVTEKALTLDYQVSNPFAYDIWVCEDIDIYGKYDVETRIADGTLQIKLRFNLDCNVLLYQAVYAKYSRLSPGELHSGRILLNLPIRNASPVYDFGEFGKKHKQVVLHHSVFEVGYFEGDLFNMLSERIEKGKRDTEALMLEGIQHLNLLSRNTVCLPHLWSGLSMEKSAKVDITDVDIPCSITVDE